MSSAAATSSGVSVAVSHGAQQRLQASAPQPDAPPFAALLDATAPAIADGGGNSSGSAPAPAAQPAQQTPSADNVAAPQASNSSPVAPATATAATGNATPGAGVSVNGMPAQSGNADGARKGPATLQNSGSRRSGTAPANGTANALPVAELTGNDDAAHAPINGTSNANAGATGSGTAAPANATAQPDASGTVAAGAAAAPAISAALAAFNTNDAAAANSVTQAPTKAPGDGKGDDQNGAPDATRATAAANQTQLPLLDAATPVAAAVVVNAGGDAVPAVAKPGLPVADAVKARGKALPAAGALDQNAAPPDDSADAPASAAAPDSGATDAAVSSAGADGTMTSAVNAQAPDQPPTPGAATAALLNQMDLTASGTLERVGLHADATAPLNGAAAAAAPGAGTAPAVPNFGVVAANAMTASAASPAASAAAPAVPLAGLAVAIAARAQDGSSQFDIRLDPPELGRIDVRLGVDGSGQVTTHVTVDRADTLQLLQSQQPQLERALEQAGLKTADNGLQFTLRDQSFAGQNGGSGGQQQAAPPTRLVIPEPDVAPIDTAQIYARLRLGNGLDIRV